MAADEKILTPVPGIETLTYDDVVILLNIQRLWMELIEWIRYFFRSAFENLPDQSVVANQLFFKLPSEIGDEFKKHYSEAESKQFLNIISRMISGNWQLASAYRNNDKTAIELSTDQLYQIADELAKFIASVNKYLDKDKLKALLHEYVFLKIKEIPAFLSGDYAGELKIYEKIEDLAVRMANYWALGIVAQRRAKQRSAGYYFTMTE
jgi:hypothetical protein